MPVIQTRSPGGASEAKQDTTLAALTVGGIRLDAATLAALETINAIVSGTVALDAPTLAALEAITVSGIVALDAPTLAALENVTAAVTGTVAVSNLPATQTVAGTVALDAASLAALESITALVSGTVAVSNLPATQTVAGTVGLDGPTLAALESTTVTVSNPTTAPETGLAKDATLAEVRDTVLRRTDPIATGSNAIGFVSDTLGKKLIAGQVWFAGGKATTALATPNASVHILNPAGSGKNVTVFRFSFSTDNSAEVTYFRNASSSGTVQLAVNANWYVPNAAQPSAVVKVGTMALAGGTQLSPINRLVANTPQETDLTIIIAPGESAAVRYIGPGAVATFWGNVFFIEEPI